MPKYLENKGSNKKDKENEGGVNSAVHIHIYKTPLIAELSFHYNMCC